jgi:peptidylprolyl isomerase
MRRTPLALLVLATVTLVACGGDDDDADTADTTAPSATSGAPDETVPEVSLEPATTVPRPEVQIPSETPTELVITELQPGEGSAAANGDTVVVDYIGVRSEDGTEFDSNYGSPPFPVVLGQGGVIEGWDQGLEDAQAGARIQLDIPADLAYGDQPQGEIIQPGDALSFVIDVLAVVPQVDPADAPVPADVPTSDEPATEVAVEELTPGDGAVLEEGGSGVVHLVAARGDNGEVLQSTWQGGQPQVVVLDRNLLLPALADGLEGMQVGGRRAVTIPQSALGADVASSLGLPADVNVVVIADLFAVL